MTSLLRSGALVSPEDVYADEQGHHLIVHGSSVQAHVVLALDHHVDGAEWADGDLTWTVTRDGAPVEVERWSQVCAVFRENRPVGDVVDVHMRADILTAEQITRIAEGITDADEYTLYVSPNGRSGWGVTDRPSGRFAADYLRVLARGHALTGTADRITAAPDGTGGDLAWYVMEK